MQQRPNPPPGLSSSAASIAALVATSLCVSAIATAASVCDMRAMLRLCAEVVASSASGKAAPLVEAPAATRRGALAPAQWPESKAWTNLSSMFDSGSQLSSSGLCPRHLTKKSRSTARAGCRVASKLSTSYHGAPAASTSTTPPWVRFRFLLATLSCRAGGFAAGADATVAADASAPRNRATTSAASSAVSKRPRLAWKWLPDTATPLKPDWLARWLVDDGTSVRPSAFTAAQTSASLMACGGAPVAATAAAVAAAAAAAEASGPRNRATCSAASSAVPICPK
eukprot:scaffold13406_cov63-Phaeocystis_antarctica.AAC.2